MIYMYIRLHVCGCVILATIDNLLLRGEILTVMQKVCWIIHIVCVIDNGHEVAINNNNVIIELRPVYHYRKLWLPPVPLAVCSRRSSYQQLTCPVCLEQYTQPRTLPCLHSFCHAWSGPLPPRGSTLTSQCIRLPAESTVTQVRVLAVSSPRFGYQQPSATSIEC